MEAACQTVGEIRTYKLGQTIDPPAVIVGPPRLLWEAQCVDGGPTSAEFSVFLVTRLDERATEVLFELVPQVVLAIEEQTKGTVSEANPTVYEDLPGYELRTLYPLW